MLTLNKQIKTKKNKLVIPYSIEGDMVYCFDESKKTIVLKLSEFDLNKKTKKEEIMVKPIMEMPKEVPVIETKPEILEAAPVIIEDQLFEKEVIVEDLYPEESKGNIVNFISDKDYV